MPRPITAVIHRQALQNNLAVVRKAMPNSKVFAVVKANAYGLGAAPIAGGGVTTRSQFWVYGAPIALSPSGMPCP